MVHEDRLVVSLINSYATGRGVSVSYAARIITGSGDTVARIERGMSLTNRRSALIVQRLSDHWPSDLEWPADIPRPPVTPPEPEEAPAGDEAAPVGADGQVEERGA